MSNKRIRELSVKVMIVMDCVYVFIGKKSHPSMRNVMNPDQITYVR